MLEQSEAGRATLVGPLYLGNFAMGSVHVRVSHSRSVDVCQYIFEPHFVLLEAN